jgi:hypothetical protein
MNKIEKEKEKHRCCDTSHGYLPVPYALTSTDMLERICISLPSSKPYVSMPLCQMQKDNIYVDMRLRTSQISVSRHNISSFVVATNEEKSRDLGSKIIEERSRVWELVWARFLPVTFPFSLLKLVSGFCHINSAALAKWGSSTCTAALLLVMEQMSVCVCCGQFSRIDRSTLVIISLELKMIGTRWVNFIIP